MKYNKVRSSTVSFSFLNIADSDDMKRNTVLKEKMENIFLTLSVESVARPEIWFRDIQTQATTVTTRLPWTE